MNTNNGIVGVEASKEGFPVRPMWWESRRLFGLTAILLVALTAWLASAVAASADPLEFNGPVTAGAFNQDGTDFTQAGGRPWEIRTQFGFNTVFDQRVGLDVPAQSLKDSTFQLPAGLIGSPTAVPQCKQSDMNDPLGNCPTNTQVGYADIDLAFVFGRQNFRAPIYNMVPPAGQPAQFAFLVVAAVAHIDLTVRSDGDYGVTATVRNANGASPIYGATIHLWGVPADSSHDALRFRPIVGTPGDENGNPLPSGLPRRPLLRNPTSCVGPLKTDVTANSWQEPDHQTSTTAPAPAVTGCDQVPFEPSIALAPDSRSAGSSAGTSIDINAEQSDDPDGLGDADVKRVVMSLPPGLTINPSSADGLAGCADADFGVSSKAPDACPLASKIGKLKLTTPLLDHPLDGSVYLGAPLGTGPLAVAEGKMFRMFLTAEGSGVRIKLAGSVVTDPNTNRLTATFDNNPQLPFSNLHLDLFGGDRATLVTPKACGTYTTTAEISPWSAPDHPVTRTNSFTIDQNCDRAGKFEPTVDVGLTNPVAGGSSPFLLTLSRPDGQQDFTGLTATLPAGVLARVGSVPLCGSGEAAAGTCPAASLIGHVSAASGAGPTPLNIPQAGKAPTGVYLSGPYNGAPYSLVMEVPAQAGPFDLGNVTVRAALLVDPVDAHVTVISDPIPTQVAGVPLNLQKIQVIVDRPGFMVNPTSCDPMAVGHRVTSAEMAVTGTTRFQVGGCSNLRVDPKLSLDLSGKGQTTDGKHPAIAAHLTMPATGQANLEKVKVTLPLALALDPENSQSDDLCEFEVGKQTIPNCPASSIVGSATAVTPLLNVPLTGPVYFVKNVRTDAKTGRQIRTLPTLVIPLRGGGITLVLRASSDVVGEHLVTTFDKVPDAPVSDFKLNIKGGKKGILVVSGVNICKANQVTNQVATGHNGKVQKANITMGTPCALGISASSHTPSALKLTVAGLGAGKVTVSGKGLTKTSRKLAKANVATLQPKFTKSVKSQLARGRNVRIRVAVAFKANGSTKTKTVHKTLTVHGAKR